MLHRDLARAADDDPENAGGGRTVAYNVTFPARQYAVNGERRSFALLRPADGNIEGQERIRQLIIGAYTEYAATGDERVVERLRRLAADPAEEAGVQSAVRGRLSPESGR